MPFEVKIRHNWEHKGATESPRFFFDLNLSSILPRQARSTVPVYCQPQKTPHPLLKEIYWTEFAGARLERGNLMALERAVPEAIAGMVNFGTFPYYFFTLPGGEKLTAYHSEGQFCLKLPQGGVLTADEVGELWQKLGDSLLAHKKLASREQEVAQSLLASRALSSPFDLALDRLNPEVGERMAGVASPTGFALNYIKDGQRVELPLSGVGGGGLCRRAAEPKAAALFPHGGGGPAAGGRGAKTGGETVQRLYADFGKGAGVCCGAAGLAGRADKENTRIERR